jgi:probable F420-dependent oxidoreductase
MDVVDGSSRRTHMRYSIALPHLSEAEEFADPDVLADVACAIERVGFDACAVMDHPFPLLEDPRAGGQAFDMFAMGGYLAAATKRLAIHLNIIVMGYRNPFVVARSVSTLDHLARGRLMVGIAAGYMKAEFDALGANFERRSELVDEGVVAMKAAWSGDPVTLESSSWRAAGNSMLPRPFTDPHPKLFRGGNSKSAMRGAVQHFDGWNPFEAPRDLAREARTAPIDSREAFRERVALLRELEQEAGRETPLEISLDKPDPLWLTRGPQAVIEEVEQLDDIGVDWLVVYLPGSSSADVIDRVQSFASNVLRSRQVS